MIIPVAIAEPITVTISGTCTVPMFILESIVLQDGTVPMELWPSVRNVIDDLLITRWSGLTFYVGSWDMTITMRQSGLHGQHVNTLKLNRKK